MNNCTLAIFHYIVFYFLSHCSLLVMFIFKQTHYNYNYDYDYDYDYAFRDKPSTSSMSFCLFLLYLCFLYLYYLLDFLHTFFSDTIKCDEWMNVYDYRLSLKIVNIRWIVLTVNRLMSNIHCYCVFSNWSVEVKIY